MSAPVLEVRAVTRRYGARAAVSEASFRMDAGRIVCLLGPSGCGKSTLLRLIAGLEPVSEGEVAIGGHVASVSGASVVPESRGVGLVFQDLALFPHLSVAGNVGFGLSGLPEVERDERVAALLSRFHIEHLARAWPHTLSGGEQQRVAIARAMAREPALLLLDEPFSGLDGQLRSSVRQSVLADLRAAGASVLIVTHDPEEAMLIADELILMAEGRILQTGSPQDCYFAPVSREAARLLGEVALLPACIAGGVAHTAFGTLPAADLRDGEVEVMVRPEALRPDSRGILAEVIDVRFGGVFQTVTLRVGTTSIAARLTGRPLDVGTQIGISLDPDRTRILSS